jgi:GNAT superfamily N-acetyltransferase
MGKVEGQGESWHGHVTALSVAPEYRRQKLAKKLMTLLEDFSDQMLILTSSFLIYFIVQAWVFYHSLDLVSQLLLENQYHAQLSEVRTSINCFSNLKLLTFYIVFPSLVCSFFVAGTRLILSISLLELPTYQPSRCMKR